MVGSESAEVLVRMTLEGMEVALKIAGSGAKNLAVMLYTMAKDKKTTKGKTNLKGVATKPLFSIIIKKISLHNL